MVSSSRWPLHPTQGNTNLSSSSQRGETGVGWEVWICLGSEYTQGRRPCQAPYDKKAHHDKSFCSCCCCIVEILALSPCAYWRLIVSRAPINYTRIVFSRILSLIYAQERRVSYPCP
ncbi:unnamed protein product [Ectocarpus sp. 4 AP-2014]